MQFQGHCFLFEDVEGGTLLKRADKQAVSWRMETMKPGFLWIYALG